jgi:branched-chain amino acid transport system permease protein
MVQPLRARRCSAAERSGQLTAEHGQLAQQTKIALCGRAIGGALLFVPVLRIKGHCLALVTTAFGVIFNITLNNIEAVGGPQGIVNISGFTILGVDLNESLHLLGTRYHYYTNYFYLSVMLAIFAVWASSRIINSPVGLILNSIRDDEWSARTAGVPVDAWKMIGGGTWVVRSSAWPGRRTPTW